jgi:mRNA-degrading endonuclease RelE of RelBE toxin-antitoxin system
VGHRYNLDLDPLFDADLSALDAFAYPRIRSAIASLQDQAEVRTRNRRPLRGAVWWCPEATWQLRVGEFRVLYRVEGRDVRLLRVRWKGTRTTEEMGP